MRSESIFKFKQFEVSQAGCAMKINTDGVLIGAMANHIAPKNILDIGTGTGVITLMLAQRFPDAVVKAVEIDKEAAETAAENFKSSNFHERLSVENIGIEKFTTSEKFDLIVSNPPFFTNDLKNVDEKKGIARHATDDFFAQLIEKVAELLYDDGLFWVILPVKQAISLLDIALHNNLYISRKIHVFSDESKSEVRTVLCFAREKSTVTETNFYIYKALNQHTDEYKILLKEFFLAF